MALDLETIRKWAIKDSFNMDVYTLREWLASNPIVNLLDELERLDKLFQSLTPGGSEFVNDPERCVNWANDRIHEEFEITRKIVLERNAAEEKVKQLEILVGIQKDLLDVFTEGQYYE